MNPGAAKANPASLFYAGGATAALLRQGFEHRLPGIGRRRRGGVGFGWERRGRRLKARSLELIGWGPGWPFAAHGVSGRPGKRVAGQAPIRTP